MLSLRHQSFTLASSGVMPHGNEEAQVYPERVHVPGWSVDGCWLRADKKLPCPHPPSPILQTILASLGRLPAHLLLHTSDGFRRSLSPASQWVLPLLPRFVVWLPCPPVFASPGQMPLPVATSLLLGVCLCLLTSMVVVCLVNGPRGAAVGVAVKPPDESFRRLETATQRPFL